MTIKVKDRKIGLCEGWCGCVDHNLVDGLCANCHKRTKTIVASNAALNAANISKPLSLVGC